MKPSDVSRLTGIPASSLRTWSGEYAEYLSPAAAGGDGRKRDYSDQDIRILMYVADQKARNVIGEDIHASLKSMKITAWIDLPPLPNVPPGMEPVALIPREAAETKIDMQRQALYKEIEWLQKQIEALEDELQQERADKKSLQAELSNYRERYGELKGQLTERQTSGELISQNKELAQQVGELQGKLAERQSTRFWLVVVAVLVAATIVVVVVLITVRGG